MRLAPSWSGERTRNRILSPLDTAYGNCLSTPLTRTVTQSGGVVDSSIISGSTYAGAYSPVGKASRQPNLKFNSSLWCVLSALNSGKPEMIKTLGGVGMGTMVSNGDGITTIRVLRNSAAGKFMGGGDGGGGGLCAGTVDAGTVDAGTVDAGTDDAGEAFGVAGEAFGVAGEAFGFAGSRVAVVDDEEVSDVVVDVVVVSVVPLLITLSSP